MKHLYVVADAGSVLIGNDTTRYSYDCLYDHKTGELIQEEPVRP